MSYNSLEEIVRECQEKDLPFDEVILLDDMNERNVSREETIETMRGMWEAKKRSCGRRRKDDARVCREREHALRTVCRKSYGICTCDG